MKWSAFETVRTRHALPLLTGILAVLHGQKSALARLPSPEIPTPHSATFTLDPLTESGELLDPNNNSGYLWQGFSHTWERRAFGIFRTPHRISQLSSRILEERHYFDRNTLRFEHEAKSDMSQSTGVDGDWMRPVIHYGIFHASALEVKRGNLRIEFTDDTEANGRHGNAASLVRGEFKFKARTWQTLGNPKVEPLLHGFALKTQCVEPDPEKRECNSNGIWPYRFRVGLKECSRTIFDHDSHDAEYTCSYEIEVGRAWTPNKGGLPPFEIKPLNRMTHYQFDLGVQLISGADQSLQSRHESVTIEGLKSSPGAAKKGISLATSGTGHHIYPSAMLGIRGFGFEFTGDADEEAWAQGRYLSGVGVAIIPEHYDPATGVFRYQLRSSTHRPGTVKSAQLAVNTDLTLLQFKGRDAVHEELMSEEGLICINSSEQAPLFSKWNRCDRIFDQKGN